MQKNDQFYRVKRQIKVFVFIYPRLISCVEACRNLEIAHRSLSWSAHYPSVIMEFFDSSVNPQPAIICCKRQLVYSFPGLLNVFV